jgi:bifunctional enzyme CysN/CysC
LKKVNQIKIMTCGNVDDGKSTLLGRLFFETGNLTIDQSKYLEFLSDKFHNISKKSGKSKIDYSMLLDGLIDEKKQGITIDIAYKFFSIDKKSYVFIDSPGHEEYTKNMSHAASHANVAILIVDVTKPLTNQTKNHLTIVSNFPNINEIIVCVNKMDKVNYRKKEFSRISKELIKFSNSIGVSINHFVPISALEGDNITSKSKKTKFYRGEYLLEIIKNLNIKTQLKHEGSYLRIQNIFKENDKRIYLVEHSGKRIKKNDTLINSSSGESTKIKIIYNNFSRVDSLSNSNASLEFESEISVSVGDIFIKDRDFKLSNSIKCRLIVSKKDDLVKNGRYLFQFRHFSSKGFISKIKGGVSSYIIECTIELDGKYLISNFKDLYDLSKFMIIDLNTNETLGFGYVLYNLDKGSNIHTQLTSKYKHSVYPKALWLTGLPASGKTTIANEVGKKFNSMGVGFYILDGDNLRLNINKDLGFSIPDRIENNRRVAHIAKILLDSGIFPIVSTISPQADSRKFARDLIGEDNFYELYVKTSLETCIKRDPKNLYKNKLKNNKNITGMHQEYEIPINPDLTLDTEKYSVAQLRNQIFELLNLDK